MVITELTRSFLRGWHFVHHSFSINIEFLLGLKIKYFVVLSISSCEKFLEEMRNYIHGELSEWSKVQHSKTFKCLRTEIAEKPLTLRFSGITSLLKRFEF